MGDLEAIVFTLISVAGIIYASYMGYRKAKREDSTVSFDANAFIDSLFRAVPGIVAACGVGAFAVSFETSGALAVFMALMLAFQAGTGSDVAVKRSWLVVKTKAAGGSVIAQASVAKVAIVRRLIFLQFRR